MEQQRQDREDEIREMSLKLRRKYAIILILYIFSFNSVLLSLYNYL